MGATPTLLMIVVVTTTCTDLLRAAAIPYEFPGFIHYPSRILWSDTGGPGPWSSCEDENCRGDHENCPSIIGCVTEWGGNALSDNATHVACDESARCDYWDAEYGNVGSLLRSATYDLYISNATCGPLGGGTPGWARGLLDPSVRYMTCLNGFFPNNLNTYTLPPSLIYNACKEDSRCTAFHVKQDLSEGTTMQAPGRRVYTHPDYVGFLKIPEPGA